MEFIRGYRFTQIHNKMISDTTTQQIVLSKFEYDTTILVQIDVPSMSNPYYYIATETTFDHYGFCYHCPAITIEGDSLYGLLATKFSTKGGINIG